MKSKEKWLPSYISPEYLVSDLGRVKSLKWGKERILAICRWDTTGYRFVCLRINGKNKGVAVHRLVAKTFTEAVPGKEVHHINGDVSDNRLVNLEWVTRSENLCLINGRRTPKKSEYERIYVKLWRKKNAEKVRAQIKASNQRRFARLKNNPLKGEKEKI